MLLPSNEFFASVAVAATMDNINVCQKIKKLKEIIIKKQ
jgi:hypothetical protein